MGNQSSRQKIQSSELSFLSTIPHNKKSKYHDKVFPECKSFNNVQFMLTKAPPYFLPDKVHDLKRMQFEQGCEGDWFVSAMAMAKERPDLLVRCVVSIPPLQKKKQAMDQKLAKNGKYEFQFYVNHNWEKISVDTKVPIPRNQANTPRCYFVNTGNDYNWSSLMHKAWVKKSGGYGTHLGTSEWNDLGVCLEALLCHRALVKEVEVDPSEPFEMANRLKSELEDGERLLGVTFKDSVSEIGMFPHRVYPMIDVREVNHNLQVISVRDCWNSDFHGCLSGSPVNKPLGFDDKTLKDIQEQQLEHQALSLTLDEYCRYASHSVEIRVDPQREGLMKHSTVQVNTLENVVNLQVPTDGCPTLNHALKQAASFENQTIVISVIRDVIEESEVFFRQSRIQLVGKKQSKITCKRIVVEADDVEFENLVFSKPSKDCKIEIRNASFTMRHVKVEGEVLIDGCFSQDILSRREGTSEKESLEEKPERMEEKPERMEEKSEGMEESPEQLQDSDNEGIDDVSDSSGRKGVLFESVQVIGECTNALTIQGHSNPEIRNCYFYNCTNGILVEGHSIPKVEKCEFSNISSYAMIVKQKSNPIVRDCKFHNNKKAILIDSDSAGFFDRNHFQKHDGKTCVQVEMNSHPIFVHNRFQENNCALSIDGAKGKYVENRITKCNGDAVNISGSTCLLKKNSFQMNKGSSLVIQVKSNVTCEDNVFSYSKKEAAVDIRSESNVHFSGNTFEQCESHSLMIQRSTGEFNGDKFLHNDKSAVVVVGNRSECEFSKSTFDSNSCTCFEFQSSGSMVTKCNFSNIHSKEPVILVSDNSNPKLVDNTFEGINGNCVVFDRSQGECHRSEFKNTKASAMVLRRQSNPEISDCSFKANQDHCIEIVSQSKGIICNNTFEDQKKKAVILVSDHGSPKLRKNTFTGNKCIHIDIVDGGGDYEENEMNGPGKIAAVRLTKKSNPVFTGNVLCNFSKIPAFLIGDNSAPTLEKNVIKNGWKGLVLQENAQGHYDGNELTGHTKEAIICYNSSYGTFRKNQICKNYTAIVLVGAGGDFQENELSDNTFSVHVQDGSHPKFVKNVIQQSNSGLRIENAKGFFEGNTITAITSRDGKQAQPAVLVIKSACVLKDNKIFANDCTNVDIRDDSQCTLEGNDISSSQSFGMIVSKSFPVVKNNKIHDNQEVGILFKDKGQGIFEQNEIYGHKSASAVLEDGSECSPTFISNEFHDNEHHCVVFDNESSGKYQKNIFQNNKDLSLVYIKNGTPTFEKNEFRRNAGAKNIESQKTAILIDNIMEDNQDSTPLVPQDI